MGCPVRAHHRRLPDRECSRRRRTVSEIHVPQIADADRKISTLYDMLDYQDATNRDAKGLPFTVSANLLHSVFRGMRAGVWTLTRRVS